MTEKEKMLNGNLYMANDLELVSMFKTNRNMLEEFNQTSFRDGKRRNWILKQMFCSVGKGLHIEPPFYCDYGKNISVGDNFYANYDCILLDVCSITIGNNVFLGPRVTINTASHPLDKDVRNSGLEFGKSIRIGNDVFIGANAVINPGVTINDDVVIGSGAIVTHDLESHAIYAGNPAKKIRDIDEKERKKWVDLQTNYCEQSKK